ncbi:unnamed protein product [Cuscuta campestris]|uniref:Uncharacterized protein n=1 Tax=Cuscuta campestris TaxID=132261 RepID=A0A484LP23_9ASTE|nr:unnamed protein product [Cuscuta campestris]
MSMGPLVGLGKVHGHAQICRYPETDKYLIPASLLEIQLEGFNSIFIPVDREGGSRFYKAIDSFFGKVKLSGAQQVSFVQISKGEPSTNSGFGQAEVTIQGDAALHSLTDTKEATSTSFASDQASVGNEDVHVTDSVASKLTVAGHYEHLKKKPPSFQFQLGCFWFLWMHHVSSQQSISVSALPPADKSVNLDLVKIPSIELSVDSIQEEVMGETQEHTPLYHGNNESLPIIECPEPILVVYPENEGVREESFSAKDFHSDTELYVKEDNFEFQAFFRDNVEFDPDPEPTRMWYPDDGIEPDDHLQRWGGPKGLTTALIRNNDQGRIIFERGCVRGTSPPAPRKSLRLARRRRPPSPIRSEISQTSDDIWCF